MPARLQRFVAAEWDDGTPAPDDWNEPGASSEGISWRAFHAKLQWIHALAAWQREHKLSAQEWDRLRGACDAACQRARPYQHWHG